MPTPLSVTDANVGPAQRWSECARVNHVWAPAFAFATILYYAAAAPLLATTNAAAPRTLPGAFFFTQLVFRPEPLETPVYVLGFALIPLIACALAYAVGHGIARGYLTPKFVQSWPRMALLLGVGYVAFDVVLHLWWFPVWRQLPVRGVLAVQGLALVGFATALVLWQRRFDLGGLIARLDQLPWRRLRPLFVAALAILVLSPNYPYDLHHYIDQIAPANDLRYGKYLFQDTTTHYGLLNTYFWYGLFRWVTPVSFSAASGVIMASFWGWLVGWYLLIRAWLRSEAIAAMAVFGMLALWVIPGGSFDQSFGAPSSTPFHQLFVLVVAALVLRLARASGAARRERAALIGATAIGFYWYPDTGLYLALSTAGVLLAGELGKSGTLLRRIRAWTRQVALLGLAIVALAGGWSVLQYWQSGAWPDWSQLYFSMRVYRAGYQLFPLPAWGVFELYVMVYVGTFWYLAACVWRRRPAHEIMLPIFFTLFAILQLTYYIARSYTSNLGIRNVFLLILLAGWWWTVVVRSERNAEFVRRGLSSALAGGLVLAMLFGGWTFARAFSQREYGQVRTNFTREKLGQPDVYAGNADVLDDLAVLRREYDFLPRPAIVHWHDANILIRWGRTNALPIFHLPAILLTAEMDRVIQHVHADPPPYLFIGRTDSRSFADGFTFFADQIEYFNSRVLDGYVRERQLTTMDVYRRRDH